MSDLPDDEWFAEVAKRCEATWRASEMTARLLSTWCGRSVASLYESDRGLDVRYDGPTYPQTKDELERFVVRRQLRVDQIIDDIRSAKIPIRHAQRPAT
jgi:hypothetical protein